MEKEKENTLAHDEPMVAVIVLTWNGKALTLACLESLSKLNYKNYEIILVDNASSDGTVEAVREKYGDSVHIIRNDENLGFSRGNNSGIDAAMEKGADYILLLNNDTIVEPDLLKHLVERMSSSSRTGIAGPKIYYYDDPDLIWSAGGEVSLWKGLAKHRGIRQKDSPFYDKSREVDYVTGCALMIKREVIDKIGKLDTSYKAYFEDTDYCMRARRCGYRILYVPEGKVWHKISSSTGGQVSRKKIATKLRSTFLFLRRHAKPYHWLTIPLFFVLDVIRIVFLVATGRIRDTSKGAR